MAVPSTCRSSHWPVVLAARASLSSSHHCAPCLAPASCRSGPPAATSRSSAFTGKRLPCWTSGSSEGRTCPSPCSYCGWRASLCLSAPHQNQQLGHSVYEESAPIFVTAPEDALTGLSQASAEQPRGHAGMLLRRLKVFLFTVPIAKPQPPRISPCPCCFARLVTAAASK